MRRLADKHRRRHAGRSDEAKSECPSIARSPGREVPMTIGESSERAQSVGQTCGQAGSSAPSGVKTAAQRSATSPIRRVFSTFLAVTLAVSMTPSAALAETQDAAVSSAQEQSQELDGALAQDRNAESPESVASSAPGQTASGSPDAAASDSEQAASAQPETPAASAKPEAAQASVPQMRALPTRYLMAMVLQLRLTQPCLQARRSISRTLRTRTIATPRSRVPFPRAIPCGQMSMTKRTGRNTPFPTPARGRMPGWPAPRTRRRFPTTPSWSGSRKALPSRPKWPANTSSAR